jgi:hypothetical protein
MIRKLFNNRAFIIGLAVCSGLLMVRTVAAPFFAEPDYRNVEAPSFEREEDGMAELEVVATVPSGDRSVAGKGASDDTIWRAEQSVLSGQLTWNGAPARDPFSGVREQPAVTGTRAAGASPPVVVGVPRLDALVAGPDSLFAVLNDQIVREGDLIAGYEVTRIAPDGVRVASKYANHWLAVADMETEIQSEAATAELDTFGGPAEEPAPPTGSTEPGG